MNSFVPSLEFSLHAALRRLKPELRTSPPRRGERINILSKKQRIFGLVQIRVHLWFSKQADDDEEVSWDLPCGLSCFTRTPGQRRAKRLHERGAETGKWLGMNC